MQKLRYGLSSVLFLLVLKIIPMTSLHAQSANLIDSDNPVVAEVLAINERMNDAVLAGDVSVFKKILSDDLVMNDPRNNISSKQDLLGLYASGSNVYREVSATVDYAKVHDDIVVVMGTESTVFETPPSGSSWRPGDTISRRYTNIYRNEAGSWKLIVKQSTVISPD